MATFTDGLNGTSGDLLRLRTDWERTIGADDVLCHSGGTGFRGTNGTTAANGTWHRPTSGNQPSTNDQYAKCVIPTSSTGGSWPLGVRCDTSSALGNGYLVRVNSDAIGLFKRTGGTGTLTSLGSFASTFANLSANPVTLKAVGTTISVEFMGSTVISVTDSDLASGSVAMLTRGGTQLAAIMVDNWESGDVGGGGGSSIAAITHHLRQQGIF